MTANILIPTGSLQLLPALICTPRLREAIRVKCLPQGHQRHTYSQESNPTHSDNSSISTQVQCTKPCRNIAPHKLQVKILQFCYYWMANSIPILNIDGSFSHISFSHHCTKHRPFDPKGIVSPKEGRQIAKEINAYYYETSAYTLYGVEEMFDNVVRAALIARRQHRFWQSNLKKVKTNRFP